VINGLEQFGSSPLGGSQSELLWQILAKWEKLDFLGGGVLYVSWITPGVRFFRMGDPYCVLRSREPHENGVDVMSLFKRGEPPDLDKSTESAEEAEIREFDRRDVARLRQSAEADSEVVANNIGTLLQRVAGASVAEIDRLTSELHTLRALLQSEGARVEREITEYAHFSQSAMQSTRSSPSA
jgi:hypothetical protein